MGDRLVAQRAWSPAIDSIGFIAAPLEKCTESIARWRKSLPEGARRTRTTTGDWTLSEKMDRLDLLAVETPTIELLSATDSGKWTAYFTNAMGGADPAPLGYFAELLGVMVLNVQYSPVSSGEDSRWGNCQLHMFHPGHRSRTIALAEDESGWSFEAWGDPESWENCEAYERRRKVDRFNYELLVDYCGSLGVDPFNPQFYADRSSLIEIRPPWKVTRLTRAEYERRGWRVSG